MIFSFNEGDIAELCNSAYTFKIKTSKPPLGGKVEKNYLKKMQEWKLEQCFSNENIQDARMGI